MDVLDNGVCLCNLAKVIQQKAEECVSNGTYTEVGLVDYITYSHSGLYHCLIWLLCKS